MFRSRGGNSSINSTLDVELAGDGGLIGSGEETGEYEGLFGEGDSKVIVSGESGGCGELRGGVRKTEGSEGRGGGVESGGERGPLGRVLDTRLERVSSSAVRNLRARLFLRFLLALATARDDRLFLRGKEASRQSTKIRWIVSLKIYRVIAAPAPRESIRLRLLWGY